MPQFQITIDGPDISLTIDLPVGVSIVGRAASCDIVLDHPVILRRHMRIEVSEQTVQIIPLSKRSRLRLNDQPLPSEIPSVISVGDQLRFAPFSAFLTSLEADEPAAGAGEAVAAEYEQPPRQPSGADGAPPGTNLPDYLRFAPPPPPDYTRQIPDGLDRYSVRYINYLPQIYHTDFTSRFVALIEALYMPILWQVENFDMYLDIKTMPSSFLNWVASWFGITFDNTWSTTQRRTLLAEAHILYPRRGTKKGLTRLLEIYIGRTPEIIDLQEDQEPFTFTVKFPVRERDVNRELIERLIEANKPVHTNYVLEFARRVDIDTVFSRLDF